MVSRAVIGQRLHQTATSWREVCQLLNTWIPFAESDEIDFTPYPLSALLAVSRKLDLPLDSLVPELAALTSQEAVADSGMTDRVTTDSAEIDSAEIDMAEFDVAETGTEATAPGLDTGTWDSSSLDHRGMTVLTAFAHAACPLGATDIAQALGVPLAEATEALEHLLRQPQLAGPLRLRPVPPDLYELGPRVDLLDSDQLLMLKAMDVARDGMTVIEATVLRAAIEIRYHFSSTSISDFLNENREIADRLVRRGYLQPPALTDAYIIDPDVINSLRIPSREALVYERFRSPQRSEPGNDRYAKASANAFPLRHLSFELVSSSTRPPASDTDQDSSFSASPGEDTPPLPATPSSLNHRRHAATVGARRSCVSADLHRSTKPFRAWRGWQAHGDTAPQPPHRCRRIRRGRQRVVARSPYRMPRRSAEGIPLSYIDPEQWRGSLLHLRALQGDGLLTTNDVQKVAESYGVTARTIWRRLSTDPPPGGDAVPTRKGPAPYELTQTDLVAYILYSGNISYLHRARTGVLGGSLTVAGGPIPQALVDGWRGARPMAVRTLQRAFATQLSSGMRAGMTEGEPGWRRHHVYIDRDNVPRNQIWEMDHKQLSVMVLPGRGAATRPWLTSVVDCGSRALLGWCLSTRPTQSTVLTTLRMALTHNPARGPFGGVPRLVRVDQGLEFAAESVQAALGSLSVNRNRLPGYEPHLKGKIERLHLTVEQTLIKGLPGYTHGARDKAGQLLGPLSDDPKARADAQEAKVKPWTLEHFAHRFTQWVYWYNTEKPHSMLNGATPVNAWEADPFELYRIPAETIRHLLLATKEHTIGKNGIHFKSRTYHDRKLNGHVSERVILRYMPHEPDFVEVYLNGKHLCTARSKDDLTKEDKDAIYKERQAEVAELKRLHGQARKAASEELMLAGDAPDTQRATSTSLAAPVSHDAPRRPTVKSHPPALPAKKKRNPLTRHDLLGITDPFTDSDVEPTAGPPVDLSSYQQPDEGSAAHPQ